jgi:hypothetical protein
MIARIRSGGPAAEKMRLRHPRKAPTASGMAEVKSAEFADFGTLL